MTKTETGGAAFPVIPACDDMGEIPAGYPFPEPGMSLREYYAGQALAGMCQACGWQGGDFNRMARHAVVAADELLVALRARGGTNAE